MRSSVPYYTTCHLCIYDYKFTRGIKNPCNLCSLFFDFVKVGVGPVRIEYLVAIHDGDEVFGVGEVDDVVGVTGEHDDTLDFVTTHLVVEDFVGTFLAKLDEAVARDDDELFPLGVVPMLALGDAGLGDVDAYLSAIEGVDEFGE